MSNNSPIYLDYAAATPVSERVLQAMLPYMSQDFYNPSAIYLDSQRVKKAVESARSQVAQVIGARPDEIVYTAGATESCNLAISGVLQMHPEANIVTTEIEHSAVLEPAALYDNQIVGVDSKGLVNVEELKQLINDKTVLVSIIHANNEIGTVQHFDAISQAINSVRQDRKSRGVDLPILLHTDASQSANYLDINVARLGVDLMTLNGAKIYGPKQTGILYVRAGVEIKPLILGGGQEWGRRSGTENVAAVIGFSEALRLTQGMRKDESYRLSQIQHYTLSKITDVDSRIIVNGSTKHRLPNIINFSIDGLDGERLVMMLDEVGIQCATGAACSAMSDESSHVLKALGLSESEARGSIRISMGRQTTKEQMDILFNKLKHVLENYV